MEEVRVERPFSLFDSRHFAGRHFSFMDQTASDLTRLNLDTNLEQLKGPTTTTFGEGEDDESDVIVAAAAAAVDPHWAQLRAIAVAEADRDLVDPLMTPQPLPLLHGRGRSTLTTDAEGTIDMAAPVAEPPNLARWWGDGLRTSVSIDDQPSERSSPALPQSLGVSGRLIASEPNSPERHHDPTDPCQGPVSTLGEDVRGWGRRESVDDDGAANAETPTTRQTLPDGVTAPAWRQMKTKAGKQRRRLPLACFACRQKKVRCSGESPSCKHCLRWGITCVYKTRTQKALSRKGSKATSEDMLRLHHPATVDGMDNGEQPATLGGEVPTMMVRSAASEFKLEPTLGRGHDEATQEPGYVVDESGARMLARAQDPGPSRSHSVSGAGDGSRRPSVVGSRDQFQDVALLGAFELLPGQQVSATVRGASELVNTSRWGLDHAWEIIAY